LAYAKAIIRASGGELLLVHVAQVGPVLAVPEGSWIPDDSGRIEVEQRQTDEAAAALRREGLKVKAFCPFGRVGQTVAHTAEICHADLVVIATHARRGLNRLVFGSYTEETAGFVDTPLLIIGPRAPFISQAKWKPNRILCSTSFARGETTLVAFAYLLSMKYGAAFDILNFATSRDRESISEWPAFRSSVSTLLSEQDLDWLPPQAIQLPEPRARSLTEAVIARGADLLVIGGDSQQWRMLHQGTLQELICDVPCPILTSQTR
jgi:nucleotide-binding universal stress UspA family protein